MRDPRLWTQEVQRVCRTNEIGGSWNMRNSFVLFEGGTKKKAKIRVGKVLVIFGKEVRGRSKEGNYHFTVAGM